LIINETMMWLNKFTKENIEDDNKKKEHAHRQTESCSNSNAYVFSVQKDSLFIIVHNY